MSALLACLGRLGEVVAVRGSTLHAPRERFVSYEIAPSMTLLNTHHGTPLAILDTAGVEPDGRVLALFDPLDDRAARQIEALAARSKSLSIEFVSQREEVRPDVTLHGGSCLMHHGATITGIAFATNPARDDAMILHVPKRNPAVQTRTALPETRYPKALQDRLAGKICYGAPSGRVVSIR